MKYCSQILLGFAVALASCRPHASQPEDSRTISERATVKLIGNKVAVITGLIINNQLSQCFDNSGVDVAKGWAGALADQWYYAHTGALKSTEILWSSYNTKGLFCATFDAIFTLTSASDAQKFATFISSQLGNTKREVARPMYDASKMEVYIEGVDLPIGHHFFGPNKTVDATSITVLSKREGFGSCNNRCSFDFTHDQTSICRDTTFPDGNYAFC